MPAVYPNTWPGTSLLGTYPYFMSMAVLPVCVCVPRTCLVSTELEEMDALEPVKGSCGPPVGAGS